MKTGIGLALALLAIASFIWGLACFFMDDPAGTGSDDQTHREGIVSLSFASIFLVFALILLSGCASPLEIAKTAADAVHDGVVR